MREIGKIDTSYQEELNINVIPNNIEKYMAFMLDGLVFIDSFQFMSSTLEKLVNNIPEGKFKYISKVFQGQKLKLMKQKGVYPYDYCNDTLVYKEKSLLLETEYQHFPTLLSHAAHCSYLPITKNLTLLTS